MMRKLEPCTTASVYRACWGFRANLIADEADLRYASCNFLYYKALESRLLAFVREVRSNEINLVARSCKDHCATIQFRAWSFEAVTIVRRVHSLSSFTLDSLVNCIYCLGIISRQNQHLFALASCANWTISSLLCIETLIWPHIIFFDPLINSIEIGGSFMLKSQQ